MYERVRGYTYDSQERHHRGILVVRSMGSRFPELKYVSKAGYFVNRCVQYWLRNIPELEP